MTGSKKVAEAINKSLHTKVDVEKVKMLESMFEKDERFQKLAAPHRVLLKQGELNKRFSKKGLRISSSKNYAFFLFNDILVYATPSRSWKSGGGPSYKMKAVITLDDMKIKEVWQGKSKSSQSLEIQITTKTKKELLVGASDQISHTEWMRALQDAINNYKISQQQLSTVRYDGSDARASLSQPSNKAAKLLGQSKNKTDNS